MPDFDIFGMGGCEAYDSEAVVDDLEAARRFSVEEGEPGLGEPIRVLLCAVKDGDDMLSSES